MVPEGELLAKCTTIGAVSGSVFADSDGFTNAFVGARGFSIATASSLLIAIAIAVNGRAQLYLELHLPWQSFHCVVIGRANFLAILFTRRDYSLHRIR